MWRVIRIAILLLILIGVVAQTWLDRVVTTQWTDTIWVGIFPLNADGSAAAERHIQSLGREDFSLIETFFAEEGQRYGIGLAEPVHVELYPQLQQLPPALAPDSGVVATMWWSLKLRWYAYRAADVKGQAPSHIRVFVLFHDPAITQSVPHSLGMRKGLIGVVHAFADVQMKGANNIVVAHEVMHTLGATDKYDLTNNEPTYPDGFADPDREPLYPQEYAEIMAGRRPLSATESEMPRDLRRVVIGNATATEIKWMER